MTAVPALVPALMIAVLCFWIAFSEAIPTWLRNLILSVGCADVLVSGIYDGLGYRRLWAASIYLDLFAVALAVYAIWRKHLIGGPDDGY